MPFLFVPGGADPVTGFVLFTLDDQADVSVYRPWRPPRASALTLSADEQQV